MIGLMGKSLSQAARAGIRAYQSGDCPQIDILLASVANFPTMIIPLWPNWQTITDHFLEGWLSWFKALDSKSSVGQPTEGSNPSPSALTMGSKTRRTLGGVVHASQLPVCSTIQ